MFGCPYDAHYRANTENNLLKMFSDLYAGKEFAPDPVDKKLAKVLQAKQAASETCLFSTVSLPPVVALFGN